MFDMERQINRTSVCTSTLYTCRPSLFASSENQVLIRTSKLSAMVKYVLTRQLSFVKPCYVSKFHSDQGSQKHDIQNLDRKEGKQTSCSRNLTSQANWRIHYSFNRIHRLKLLITSSFRPVSNLHYSTLCRYLTRCSYQYVSPQGL